MKNTLLRMVVAAVIFVVCSSAIWAQEAVTNHNVILRRDPATTSPALAHLADGARLTLVDARPSSGFFHVKTEDDQVGWVFAKFVAVTPVTAPTAPTTPAMAGSDSCDVSIATHVYHPKRLIVKQDCIAVTGTIMDATAPQHTHTADGTRHEGDGDTHGWLKVDSGFENLLNAGNLNDEGGNLVFEIICRFPVTQADADGVPGVLRSGGAAAGGFACQNSRKICAGYVSRTVERVPSGDQHYRDSLSHFRDFSGIRDGRKDRST